MGNFMGGALEKKYLRHSDEDLGNEDDDDEAIRNKFAKENQSKEHTLLQDMTLQEHFNKPSGMSNLPRKNIDNESDIFDFLLFDQMPQEELLSNLEGLILSIAESATVYLRIGKLFNFISRKLDLLLTSNNILDEEAQLNELLPFMDLFKRCTNAVRFTSFSEICLMPDFRMQLDINKILFDKLLRLVTTQLEQLPPEAEKHFISFILFVTHTPDPYTTPIEKPAEYILNNFAQNLFSYPNKSFFKFLSLMFLVSPTELVPRYIELVILPLNEIMLTSLKSRKADKKVPEESKLELIEGFELEEEDEMDYQILRFLLISLHNQKVTKHLVEMGLQDTLYGILRTTCKAFSKDPIKLTPRVTKMASNIVANLLTELDESQLSTFKEIIYGDICTSIEEQKINFVLTIVMPILAGVRHKVTPLCLHLDDEIESSLNQYRSKISAYLSPEKQKGDNKGFNSEAFSNQEKTHLMQSIQQLALTPLSSKLRVRLTVSRCEWKRLFKVDYATQFPFNSAQLHDDVTKHDGLLVVFHCLVNDEICKLGAFCAEPLTRLNPSVGYGTNTQKVGYASPESFVFHYSQTHKTHYLSELSSLNDPVLLNNPISGGDVGAGAGAGGHHLKNPLQKPLFGKKEPHKHHGKKHLNVMPISKNSGKVFVDFSDNKIAITLNGTVLVEYIPSNPDNSKVTPNFKGMLSEEEKKGQKVYIPFYDPSGFSCVQGVEFWALTYPKDQKQMSDDDIFADFNAIPIKLLSEYFGYARDQQITFAPRDLTLGQVISLFSKPHEKDMVSKINCRLVHQENIEPVHQTQKVLDMYQGSTQGVLDLFLSSQQGINWLKERFANRDERFYERLLNFSKSESKMIQSLLAPERLAEILQKTKILAGQKNKTFLTDFNAFYSQVQLFLQIGSYHVTLVENDMLFYTILQLLGYILKNDVLSYRSSCIGLKLDHLLYHALHKVLKSKGSSENLSKVNMTELIHLLLNKIAEANKTIDSSIMHDSKAHNEGGKIGNSLAQPNFGQLPSFIGALGSWAQSINKKLEDSPLRKRAVAMEKELSKKTFQNLLSCAGYLFNKNLSTQARKETAAKIKQLKLIAPISKFVGDLDESQNVFHKEMKSNENPPCINLN